MIFVLYNGFVFWVSAGVTSAEIGDATVIPEADALGWIRSTDGIAREGFYPLAIGFEGFLLCMERSAGPGEPAA